MTRRKIMCCVPGCPRWCLPRVNTRANGEVIEDTEVLCRNHWREIPIDRRRVYRRVRQAYFACAPEAPAQRVNRIWNALVRQAIETAVGL